MLTKDNLAQPVIQEVKTGIWKVKKSFTVYFSYKGVVYRAIIPLNFKTDLTSTPKILWFIYPPFGMYSRGAVAHDYMYKYKVYKRKVCDYGFRELMKQNNVGFFTRNSFYLIVRLFGWTRY